MKRRFFYVISAFSLWVTSIAAADIRLPTPELETLPNGLQVIWFVSDQLPVIDLAILVKSGFRDDLVDKSGTAELLAASLDRGAGGLSAQEVAKSVEMLGASRFSGTDEDTFTVGMHGLAGDAGALLKTLSMIVTKPTLAQEEVDREHSRLLSRWGHIGDSGSALAAVAYHRLISAGTEYGRGSLISEKEFKQVKHEDVVQYHRTHFTPKNSVLMVVGRIKKDEFRKTLIENFGEWKGEEPVRKRKPFADPRLALKKGQILLVDRPGLTQAQVRIGFKAPSIQSPDRYPLAVANAFLGEYFQSRLNSVIRDELGLTYAISSSFSYSKDLARFTIDSATRNESVGQLLQKTMDILKGMKKGDTTPQEVQTAKEYLVGGYPLSVATLGAVASRWLGGYIFNLGPNYLNEFVPKIEAVNRDQVAEALAKHFDLDGVVIVIAGDAKTILPGLKSGPYKTIKRVSVSDLM